MYDSTSGVLLPAKMATAARTEELGYCNRIGIGTKVPTSECYDRTGKAPIPHKWVDVNKGDGVDEEKFEIKSRLCAAEAPNRTAPQQMTSPFPLRRRWKV